jgi:phage N-6-adenine-methyltransferase
MNPHFLSLTNEWRTPPAIYEQLDAEFGFTYDPCPLDSGEGFIADGLLCEWGTVTFCNPPYSDIKAWVTKAWEQSKLGKTIVLLIPSRTDTSWWHDYCMKATEIRYIRGRLKFGDATNSAPFPSCVVVFRGRPLTELRPVTP